MSVKYLHFIHAYCRLPVNSILNLDKLSGVPAVQLMHDPESSYSPVDQAELKVMHPLYALKLKQLIFRMWIYQPTYSYFR